MEKQPKQFEKRLSVLGWMCETKLMWLKCLVVSIGLIGLAEIFIGGEGWGGACSVPSCEIKYCNCKFPGTAGTVWVPKGYCRDNYGECAKDGENSGE